MENDVVFDTLGVSADEELSVRGIRRIFQKVLQVSVNPQDVQRAIRKVTGGTDDWFCGAGKLLDVLLEIESQRVVQEESYWDFQMLNAGRLATLDDLYAKGIKPTVSSVLPTMPGSSPRTSNRKQKNQEAQIEEDDTMLGKSGPHGGQLRRKLYAWRFKRETRRLCNRLSKAGLYSILPSLGSTTGGPGGAEDVRIRERDPSKADLFQDMEDKYDLLRQKLFREMLQQYHGKDSWEALLPWQQEAREEALEALAEDALCSGDPLYLCELPGAFRLYRSSDGVVLRSCPEHINTRVFEWTAVLSLQELHNTHQLEKRTLTSLAKSLDVTGLRLLSLYVNLAVMRARREEAFHAAMLSASHAWEKWPEVGVLHNKELAKFWLAEGSSSAARRDAVEHPSCPQQAVLESLLLCHEKERRCLIDILHSLTFEELTAHREQRSAECILERLAALRESCVTRLWWMRVTLEGTSGPPSWGDCALCLLTHLIELQEREVRVTLGLLLHTENVKVLQEKYEVELGDPKFFNLHQLLLSGPGPKEPADGSNCGPSSPHKALEEDHTVRLHDVKVFSPDGQQDFGNYGGDQQDKPPISTERRDLSDVLGKADTPEEVPYLDVLCATKNSMAPEEEKMSREEKTLGTVSKNLEKQGSLIAVAWSSPAQEVCSEAPVDIEVKSEAEHCPEQKDDCADQNTDGVPDNVPLEESLDAVLFQDSLQDGSLQELPVQDGISGGEVPAEAIMTLEAKETLDKDDNCGQTAEHEPKGSQPQDQLAPLGHGENVENLLERPIKSATSDGKSVARGIRREMTVVYISEMERDETMKSLVDMHKRVESMFQRDKERQILRFQERLSIVQNRKSDEDLLGHKQREGLKHLTENLKKEDRNRQKTLVKEKLEQLRRERSYVMQSKRDRNTAGFKELLAPVVVKTAELEGS